MAAFVLTPPDPPMTGQDGRRLDIFPGAATPTVFAAHTPFWIGYGFLVDTGAQDARSELPPKTTFELLVDGEPVAVGMEARVTDGRVVGRQCSAAFANGLAPGWHRFEGRWYDAGALTLASDVSIEFVEA